MDEVMIVLLGKQGAGKSATGNTILGHQLFKTGANTGRITQTCSMQTSTVDNQRISVIDTPGWPDSLSETEIKQEIMKFFDMCSPGPHVFLLVLPIGRFTNEEINTVVDILKEFGKEAFKHMLLLFTKGDDLEGKSIEEYLENIHQYLKKTIQICWGGYHVFNNKDINNHLQVSSLLQKINIMVKKNDENIYTKTMHEKEKQREDKCVGDVDNLATYKTNYFTECTEMSTKTKIYNEKDEKGKISEKYLLKLCQEMEKHVNDLRRKELDWMKEKSNLKREIQELKLKNERRINLSRYNLSNFERVNSDN